jgi:hypothetical protein
VFLSSDIKVYRKSSYTGSYLNFDFSHLPLVERGIIQSVYSREVLSNVFIYWGASDRWLWRRGRRVAIVIIIIIIIIIIDFL